MDRVERNWKQVTGWPSSKSREQWSKLTDDGLEDIDGKRDQPDGKIGHLHDYQKDQIAKGHRRSEGRQTW
ncbi:CsbD family protein [Neorhizobium sp. BT27B]